MVHWSELQAGKQHIYNFSVTHIYIYYYTLPNIKLSGINYTTLLISDKLFQFTNLQTGS